MTKRTLSTRGEQTYIGFNIAKYRLTIMLWENGAICCKLNSLLMQRSENLGTLKNKSRSTLPDMWKANCKAWVTNALFKHLF